MEAVQNTGMQVFMEKPGSLRALVQAIELFSYVAFQ
jgi:hypothetical protein